MNDSLLRMAHALKWRELFLRYNVQAQCWEAGICWVDRTTNASTSIRGQGSTKDEAETELFQKITAVQPLGKWIDWEAKARAKIKVKSLGLDDLGLD